jgi:integrase
MKRMQPLTQPELLAVLAAARENSPRDFCMLLLTYAHGMRAHEVARLTVADVDTRQWSINIKRGKDSYTTFQTLSPNSNKLLDERKALSAWLALRPTGTPYLFPSRKGGLAMKRVQIYRLFRDYAVSAGLPASKQGVHALKHTLATAMVAANQNIAWVQQGLGHKSISSTARYFRTTDAQGDAARQAALFAE